MFFFSLFSRMFTQLSIMSMYSMVSSMSLNQVRYHHVVGFTGQAYPVHCVRSCAMDLYHHGHVSRDNLDSQLRALNDHAFNGIMPGDRQFFSYYSRQWMTFVHWIDELIVMYTMAVNWQDVTDDEEDDGIEIVIDLYDVPFPTNIGVFSMFNTRDVSREEETLEI